MPTINAARLLKDLYDLRRFGEYKTGVHRPSLSDVDMEARHWAMERFAAAGLRPEIDGIGSVFGWGREGTGRILTGSHLESQNHAGWLDGALGVIYGLEAARALGEDTSTAHIPVDVASWFDEEGHFGGFFGSRSAIGALDEAEIDAAKNRYDGSLLADHLKRHGLYGKPRVAIDASRYRGYCEAHIEQGDVLESSGNKVGVVTAIVAIWQYRIIIEGTQNHAGTTRMAIRRDAGQAAVALCNAVNARFPALIAERSVWTFGRIALDPGAPSIIPGRAEVLLQFRDADIAVLERLDRELVAIIAELDAAGPCRFNLEVMAKSIPARMDERLMSALDGAAERHAPGKWRRMPSGAGHDAQYLARIMPSSMLFVPSIGGISHHWTENTSDEDLVLGAQIYADAVAAMAAG